MINLKQLTQFLSLYYTSLREVELDQLNNFLFTTKAITITLLKKLKIQLPFKMQFIFILQ